MASTTVVTLENIPLVINWRDLSFEDPAKRLWQGDSLKCNGGVWTWSEVTRPHGTLVLVPFAFHAVQHIEADGIIHSDNMIELPGSELPDDAQLAQWNDDTPKSRWQTDRNGEPQPPWQRCWGAYVINPADAALATFLNKTNGQRVCIEKLKASIDRMSGFSQ